MNERCDRDGCHHSPASHQLWGAGPCDAIDCTCGSFMAPSPWATPQTPPTGTEVGKASPGRRALPCLAPVDQRLCILPRSHRGTHLPAAKWARTDISEANPSVRSSK